MISKIILTLFVILSFSFACDDKETTPEVKDAGVSDISVVDSSQDLSVEDLAPTTDSSQED